MAIVCKSFEKEEIAIMLKEFLKRFLYLLVIRSMCAKTIDICRIFCGAASRKHSNKRIKATSLSSLIFSL